MSELVKYAKAELRGAGLFDPDADYDGEVAPAVVAVMETFASYADSGGKRDAILAVFNRLAQGKPLTPLLGDDTEWRPLVVEDSGKMYQNVRCSTVFKRSDGVAWDSEGTPKNAPIRFPYPVA